MAARDQVRRVPDAARDRRRPARAFTRNGYDWSDRYRPIVDAARALRCSSAIIDGEMCVQGPDGVTDYAGLLRAIGSAPERLVLFAFDLLEIDGQDLRAEPLIDRRARLEELIGPPGSSPKIEFSNGQYDPKLALTPCRRNRGRPATLELRCPIYWVGRVHFDKAFIHWCEGIRRRYRGSRCGDYRGRRRALRIDQPPNGSRRTAFPHGSRLLGPAPG